MKSKVLVISVFLNLLLILAACGGAGSPLNSIGSGASKKLHAYIGAMPGFHGVTATRTTSFDISLTPKLYAQAVTTVSFTGSYSGFCSALPQQAGVGSLFYGVGSLDSAVCDRSWYNVPSDAAVNATAPAMVIGSGTIGPLVAFAQRSTSTVRIYLNRNGQAIDTGIAATLDGKRGTSTATYPVLDGDYIVAVAVSDGNPSANVQFVLAKE